jgi:hypothetical protein
MAYAFFANCKETLNRPADEHRFQVKYGPDDRQEHQVWQDPFGLYTTLFCGIDLEYEIFVGADPMIHRTIHDFMPIDYTQSEVDRILNGEWHVWERDRSEDSDDPVEVLIGGTQKNFLNYIYFEREAIGEDQGHRALLAERVGC